MDDENERKIAHDVKQALKTYAYLIKFIETGFDFKSDDGITIIKEAKQSQELLSKYIEQLRKA